MNALRNSIMKPEYDDPQLPLAASVWATQAPGSMGRTGSVRGMVK